MSRSTKPGRSKAIPTWKEHMRTCGRIYLEWVLSHAGTVTGAAKLAGLNRTSFHRMVIEYGIRERSNAGGAGDQQQTEEPETDQGRGRGVSKLVPMSGWRRVGDGSDITERPAELQVREFAE